MTDFTKDTPQQDEPGDADVVREESWTCAGTAEIEIGVDVGEIRVDLVDVPEGGTGEVRVQVRHDPQGGGFVGQGVRGIMNWVSNASSSWSGGHWDSGSFEGAPWGGGNWDPSSWDMGRLAAEAVRATEISWAEGGRRLVVRSPQQMPLRVVPLAVTVSAPAGSRLAARTGTGDVLVTGRAGWTALRTGTGRVRAGDVDGDLDVHSGSGDITVGAAKGRSRVRTGTGTISIDAAGGPIDVKTGSGDVTVGRLDGDLDARTGTGDLRVADVVSGRCDVTTGSGDLTIGVHEGVWAEVDLSSGSGTARSDLTVNSMPPSGSTAVHLRGRTGTGDVLVTRARS